MRPKKQGPRRGQTKHVLQESTQRWSNKGKQGKDHQGVRLMGRPRGGEEEEGAGIRSKHAASGVAVTAYGFISGDTHFTTIGSTVHLLGRFGFMYFAI